MTMKFGVLVPQGWRMDLVGISDPVEAYETMTRVAIEAETLGFDSIWTSDGFWPSDLSGTSQTSQEFLFECWTTTAALARDTSRVCIGQMATNNLFRHPALLAKMAGWL